jgi:hypothetical protein
MILDLSFYANLNGNRVKRIARFQALIGSVLAAEGFQRRITLYASFG